MKKNTIQDLLNNINIKEPDKCWLYIGSIKGQKTGHKEMRLNGKKAGVYVHAYEHFVGPVPEGLCVCHHCDVPDCCNPSHLFLDTRSGNIKDMNNKDRHYRKVSKENCFKIKELYKTGFYTQSELGLLFGVSQTRVSQITLL